MKFVRHKVKLRGRSHSKLEIKRNPMISVGFKRVSKKRPCRICGKPTYCGFSRDEGTSICMRIRAGALASFCATEGIEHIHFLKLDVEGHEVAVLRGAQLNRGAISMIQF